MNGISGKLDLDYHLEQRIKLSARYAEEARKGQGRGLARRNTQARAMAQKAVGNETPFWELLGCRASWQDVLAISLRAEIGFCRISNILWNWSCYNYFKKL